MAYSTWAETYYQITAEGRKKARGKLKKLFDPRLWRGNQMLILGYLVEYSSMPKSLEQIWKKLRGHWINPTTRMWLVKDITALQGKGWIKKVK